MSSSAPTSYERSVLKPVVRPLRHVERRILNWGVIRQRLMMTRLAPLITLSVGVVLFGGLWGLTVLATRADKKGPSWQMSGVIWLAIAVPILLWSHRDMRRYAARYEGSCASALRMNCAVEIQIKTNAVAVFEAGEKRGLIYAFQVGDSDTVVVAYKKAGSSARFPNSDFSLIDLFTEQKKPAIGLLEKKGKKIEPVLRISAETTAKLRIPEHLTVIHARLGDLEDVLGRNPA
jgi:hypothetical protein